MDELTKYTATALALGFTAAVPFNCSIMECKPEIRALCTPQKCQNYGKSWVCPPGCGDLEMCAEQISRFKRGILLQSKSILEDSSDHELMVQLVERHNQRLEEFCAFIRSEHSDVLLLSTGGCGLCECCTYPDASCRKPEERKGSLSAFGIDVGELCKRAGLDYTFVSGTLILVGCVLID
ncbi:MAG: DUF2284 domain-containing protein [Firmicutes bacterium]|nr:DUF2284 domain-containing protein [Bacillota bacterium]